MTTPEQSPEALAERQCGFCGSMLDDWGWCHNCNRNRSRTALRRTPAESTSAPSRAEGVGREEIARVLVPFSYGAFEDQRRVPNPLHLDGMQRVHPAGTPNDHARKAADAVLALLAPQDGASQPASRHPTDDVIWTADRTLEALGAPTHDDGDEGGPLSLAGRIYALHEASQPAPTAGVREALADAWYAGFRERDKRAPWDDMWDWAALTARDYAALATPPQPPAQPVPDGGEDDDPLTEEELRRFVAAVARTLTPPPSQGEGT